MDKDLASFKGLSKRVYKTFKSRANMADRLFRKKKHDEMLFLYYTVLIVAVSIMNLENMLFSNQESAVIILMLSIIISIFSYYMKSQNIDARYYQMKKNYHDLQYLSHRIDAKLELIENERENYTYKNIYDEYSEFVLEYQDLMKQAENHENIDHLLAARDIEASNRNMDAGKCDETKKDENKKQEIRFKKIKAIYASLSQKINERKNSNNTSKRIIIKSKVSYGLKYFGFALGPLLVLGYYVIK